MSVVAFSGVTLPNEADPEIVDCLERLLADAKSGKLRAFAYATVTDATRSTGWQGVHGTRDSLSFAISMLQYRFMAGCDGDDN